jgi:ribosomal protein S27E
MLNRIQSRGDRTMATTFVIACPDCGKQVKVSDAHVGKKVKCKECGAVYPVTGPVDVDAPTSAGRALVTSWKSRASATDPAHPASAARARLHISRAVT